MAGIVVFYTITGNNRRIAQEMANREKYDLLEFDEGSMLRVPMHLFFKWGLAKKAQRVSLEGYDDIIICGPIWNHKPAPAIRVLLENINLNGKNASCYLTHMGNYGSSENIVKDLIRERSGKVKEVKLQDISKKRN